ncbi:DNA translocase FtsK 4TM domain-containing protein [Gallaecimonas kandeliae]|uniref:DNA translocase FtsK n=1 Tax=Gallaecimonas kandeliae TaxID=3029055 RepID=UPI002649F76F|nr:DNA translocase FtsK [Gallaecimonas kandeliae]WKE67254.1 DNA translocase FtsK 4TM domain-containing protein [Gallaecimonas kandeliae]
MELRRLSGVQRLLEAGLVLCTLFSLFLLVALASFNPADPGWSQTGVPGQIQNAAGTIGAWVADILLFGTGLLAYLLPFGVALCGWFCFRHYRTLMDIDYLAAGLRLIGTVLTLLGLAGLCSVYLGDIHTYSAGGLIGDLVATALRPWFNFVGTLLILLGLTAVGITMMTGLSWVAVVDRLGALVVEGASWTWQRLAGIAQRSRADQVLDAEPQEESQAEPARKLPRIKEPVLAIGNALDSSAAEEAKASEPEFDAEPSFNFGSDPELSLSLPGDDDELDLPWLDEPGAADSEVALAPKQVHKPAPKAAPAAAPKADFPQSLAAAMADGQEAGQGELLPLPSMDLLDRPDKNRNPISQEELDAVSRLVEEKLLDFGVQANVVDVHPGPVITRFELDLAPGVKVSKISNLSKDLARALSAISVRVVEVIPGKSVIGLEVPNKHREVVYLSEVINDDKFNNNDSPLAMVLGKDIAGNSVVVDLGKMPHLLVAGTTGSGKSVGVNVMLVSLLYKSTPEDVRLIMIDPKMLELSVYEGIPHLLAEVVTDMKDAANALRWCVGEMERRYKLMSLLGVRNLKGFNKKVKDAILEGQPIKDPMWNPNASMETEAPDLGPLPRIVVVVDEFADMMMIVGKKVEELIARIAQKARAAGIHLILATQRPSVDVITGLIKANIPTRIAFQVSSKIDSRTILDQQGAESLLGQGDMLYLPPGSGVPTRVHGAFVDDHEVHRVVEDWKKRGKPQYIDAILSGEMTQETLLPGESMDEDGEQDPLYDEAVAFVIESRRGSISSVQRKLKIGYNRAARLIEQMEMAGIVSSAGHNGNRDVLVPHHGD